MRTIRKSGLWLLGSIALVSSAPAIAAMTGYVKIPDIKGESRGSSAQATYLTFKMERVLITSHQSGTSASDDRHRQWIDVLSISPTIHKPGSGGTATGHEEEIDIYGISWATARPASATALAGSKPPKVLNSSGGPGQMRAQIAWPGCRVGKSLPHVIVAQNRGPQAELRGVRVVRCAARQVTFHYNAIAVKR
ncbi:MAG: hypothetical protein KDE25_14610 [Novosphingobium sp.]|nr:hypothetical protein [Novosphingobium sp.]